MTTIQIIIAVIVAIVGGIPTFTKIYKLVKEKKDYAKACSELVNWISHQIPKTENPGIERGKLRELAHEAGISHVVTPIVEAHKEMRLANNKFKVGAEIDAKGRPTINLGFTRDF